LGRLLIFHPQLRSLREELRDQFPPLEGSWDRHTWSKQPR